ncbi:MAG: cytochrome c3 family protein [Verrucomicrobiota bacterium]
MALIAILTSIWHGPDRRMFLPGATSHGHYQIELDCQACHTPWMGVNERACLDCHEAELKSANDSHPQSKFTDPRNADRLKLVAADQCVTCHREHQAQQTKAMGVTMPEDYCFHCHPQTRRERSSHAQFEFASCATAGCHNYHDNTALYENFLRKYAAEPDLKTPAQVAHRDSLEPLRHSERISGRAPLSSDAHDAPASVKFEPRVLRDWAGTAHARAGVNCTDCHRIAEEPGGAKRWVDALDHRACAPCHAEEVDGFLASKHGMRLARALGPMRPDLARLPMKPASAHRELSCSSCHSAHTFNTRAAAVDSCLSCHNDEHSLSFQNSSHFRLWKEEMAGRTAPGTGVSCATCHLPREIHSAGGQSRVRVQHNQNMNLRPNEKMIRSVCLQCHGLRFTLDALADRDLIRSNFIGRPSFHVESIDLAVRRQMETEKTKSNP